MRHFPLDELMNAKIKRPLTVTADQIEEILDWQYKDARVQLLLIELAQDYSGREYHVDHIWPQAKLTSREIGKLAPGLSDTDKENFKKRCNYLSNLQILEPLINIQKGDTLYEDWVKV